MLEKTKKISSLKLHQSEQCDCFKKDLENSEKRCIYATFADGWDFTPDVGNGKKRGEIFTPYWVVNKMIVDSGMLPANAVYQYDYSSNSSEAYQYIINRINEPAVGTGNYTGMILFHKLRFSRILASNFDETYVTFEKYVESNVILENDKEIDTSIKRKLYEGLFVSAIASIYCYDIDPGNIQVTKQRLLSSYNNYDKDTPILNNKINNKELTNEISTQLNKTSKVSEKTLKNISKMVEKSLTEAEENWGRFLKASSKEELNTKGIIEKAFFEATGETLPEDIRKISKDLLNENIKLFNGIVKDDTVDHEKNFYVPGYKNIEWKFWEFSFDKDFKTLVAYATHKLNDMILFGESEQLKKRLEVEEDSEKIKEIRKKIKKVELELYGMNTPGSLFG